MPQGKGTYGSQVGRPSKKKYDKGGNVDPFSTRNPEGVPAEQMAEMMENQNMANEGLPTTNAQERSQASPDVTSYKEGGKVDITDIVKATSERQRNKKAISEHLKKLKRTGRDTLKTAQGETRADYWEKQQKYDQGALKETVKEQKKKILKGKKK